MDDDSLRRLFARGLAAIAHGHDVDLPPGGKSGVRLALDPRLGLRVRRVHDHAQTPRPLHPRHLPLARSRPKRTTLAGTEASQWHGWMSTTAFFPGAISVRSSESVCQRPDPVKVSE